MNNSYHKDIIPKNDTERVQVLEKYVVLNGYPEKYFNEVAHIIASTFQTQIALISFVGKTHVEYKGNFGMEETLTTERGDSLCSLAILDDNPTLFEDAKNELCLKDNPFVAGNFGLQFYAGVPIITKEGYNIGTVCVIDKKPRSFSKDEITLLSKFADNVIKELEAREVLQS